MKQKRIVASATVLGLALVLAWGCQNSKPVGPMKYVSMKASVSTKGMVKPKQSEALELLYRVTGPSMNPVSGKVTMGAPEYQLDATSSSVRASAEDSVNFTIEVPAGPSRTLAVQVNYIGEEIYRITPGMADPNRVWGIGAVRFDIDTGTPVVDVPVEIGFLCRDEYEISECNEGYVAYMGKTDLVNCAFVPNQEAFREGTCDAKNYFYGDSGRDESNGELEVGDVYCFSGGNNCYTWAQVAGDSQYMYWIYRENCTLPYYAFDPEIFCYSYDD